MKDTRQLTQLELVLLQLIEKGQGQWSWYELANALSRRDVPREPDMMTVLKNLIQQDLVKRYVESGSPRDRWELTLKGEFLLKSIPLEKMRPSGLCEGEFIVPDDFDDPLSEEILPEFERA